MTASNGLDGEYQQVQAEARPRRQVILAPSAVIGIVVPVAAFILDIFLVMTQPGYGILHDSISAVALSPKGGLETASFFVFGVSLVALAMGLRSSLGEGWAPKQGARSLALVGIGLLLAGMFRTDIGDGPHAIHFYVHILSSSAVVLLFPAACFLIALGMRGDRYWRPLLGYTIVTGVFTGLLGASLAVGLLSMGTLPLLGLVERAMLMASVLWLETVAFWLLRLSWRERTLGRATR